MDLSPLLCRSQYCHLSASVLKKWLGNWALNKIKEIITEAHCPTGGYVESIIVLGTAVPTVEYEEEMLWRE